MMLDKRVVALGGGHGLAASLRALRRVTTELTAVVGVSDNGGSSGRLREHFNVIPPGDLRMALTALCGDDEWGQLWARTLQHRFPGTADIGGHALGNLLITALWQQSEDIVAGLDAVSELLSSAGRVLPLSLTPLNIVATVNFADGSQREISGQVEVATTAGEVAAVRVEPSSALVTPQALAAIAAADSIVFGPGSWFTSVLNNLVLPDLAAVLRDSSAQKILVTNLTAQSGETEGFSPARHLEVLQQIAPEISWDVVIADSVQESAELVSAVHALGAQLICADVVAESDSGIHDADHLASVFHTVLQSASLERKTSWQ